MSKNKQNKIAESDANGNVQVTIPQFSIPQSVTKYVKLGVIGLLGLAVLQFIPGLFSLVSTILFGGAILTTTVGGFLLWKNKDVRRGLKFWVKSQGKVFAEKVLRLDPLKLAALIMDNRDEKYKEIGQNISQLKVALIKVEETLKINNSLAEEKTLSIQQAQKDGVDYLTELYAIELAEILDSNKFLEDHKEKIELTIMSLEEVEKAAKFQLDRTKSQFGQMKLRSEMVDTTYKALEAAHGILIGDEDTNDLKKAMSEHRGELAVKVSKINNFGNESKTFVDKIKIEKNVLAQRALKRIEQTALPQNAQTVIEESKEIFVNDSN